MAELREPRAEDVRAALENVLQGKRFRRSPRSSELLKYLVDQTLAGGADNLKAYSIAVDVFGRDESFNPETETLVRVQASRLRDMLDAYYRTEGAGDPVTIRLPRGGYVPEFQGAVAAEAGEAEDSEATQPATSQPVTGRPWRTVAAMLGLVCLLLAGAIAYLVARPGETPKYPEPGIVARLSATPFPWGPKVAVLDVGGDTGDAGSSRLLTFHLIHAMTRFRAIQVVSMHSAPDLNPASAEDRQAINRLGILYILQVSLGREAVAGGGQQLTAAAQIRTSSDGRIVWSQIFRQQIAENNVAVAASRLFDIVAARAASSYGIISRAERTRLKSATGPDVETYACVLGFFHYADKKSQELHREQRACLETARKAHPDVARVHAMLSWMYGDEVRYGFNTRKGDDPRARAFRSAVMAVELDPGDAFSHYYLAEALYLSGRDNVASVHFDRAIELNPNDAEMLASFAWRRAREGKWEVAEKYAFRAMALSPKHPDWFRIVPYMVYFRKKQYHKALAMVETRLAYQSPFSYLGRLAARAELGEMNEARTLMDELDRKFPGYRKRLSSEFERHRLPNEILVLVKQSIARIEAAGTVRPAE